MTQASIAPLIPPTVTAASSAPDDARDEDLVRASLGGDELAFRQLYRRHTPRLRRLVQRLLGDEGRDADDAVQEAWMRAMLHVRDFRWQSSLQTWLGAIAARVVSELHRAARKHTLALVDDYDIADRPADLPNRIDLESAIARVPAHYRIVLVMHDIEGHTHEEIAAALDIAVGTSKANLHRARKVVRALLGPRGAAS